MFAKTIVLSDAFLDMPLSARALYMTLGMVADDDGFVNNPRSIIRQCGASIDDMNVLLSKKFIIAFDSGVVVIKHWRINNYLRNDRYQETKYLEEKENLTVEQNGAYTFARPVPTNGTGIPGGIPSMGIPSIGKDSIGKNRIDKSNSTHTFVPPTVDEVKAYCDERNNKVDPDRFVDFYSSKGWMIGKNKMKDWKAAVRTWEKDDRKTDWEKELEDWANE